jgi:hypothetical protein
MPATATARMLSASRSLEWLLGNPCVDPTKPDTAEPGSTMGVVDASVVDGDAVPASCGASGSDPIPNAPRLPGIVAGAGMPVAPTDGLADVAWAELVTAVVDLEGAVVAGRAVVGGVVVTGALVVGGDVGGVVGGHSPRNSGGAVHGAS